MFYQHSSFTGRLVGSTHISPYFPLSPKPLSKNEAPKIMFETPHVKMAREDAVRTASKVKYVPGTKELHGQVPEALKKKMEHFQRNDGTLLFLKGGPADRILFGITAGLCVVGLVSIFHMVYELGVPKKN